MEAAGSESDLPSIECPRSKDAILKKQRTPEPSDELAVDQLPRAELEVLGCLWQKEEATAAQIRDHLADYRPMAHGSVLTLLKRLARKNLVVRRKGPQGKAFLYRATRRPDAIWRRILQELADRVFGGDRVAMIASLLDTRSPSEEELDEMRRLLETLSRPKDRGEER